MTQIDTIVFDLGGVLFDVDYHKTSKAFNDLGIDVNKAAYAQQHQSRHFDDLEIGKLSEHDFLMQLSTLSRDGTTTDQVKQAWNAMLVGFPQRRRALLERVKKNYRLLLLSNTNSIHEAAFKKMIETTFGHYWFDSVFDKVYLSHHIGKRKPNHETFEYVNKDAQLNKTSTLFIDDSVQHAVGALKYGWHAIHLKVAAGEEVAKLFDANGKLKE
ncbi:MAG: hypothetical protein RIQ89_1332 [Bacteroidota bacterium]|jgi:putative hydrolase of the HAD superfamily